MKRILLSFLALAALSQASALTITGNNTVAQVIDDDDTNDFYAGFGGTGIPTSLYLDATAANGDYARN